MPIEHRDVDVGSQLRAFAVALEAHAAEPIRPSPRPVDDVPQPVVVEPMPPQADRRRWLLPAVAAAAVAAVALVTGLVVLNDNSTPSDTPTSTTPRPSTTTTSPQDETQPPSATDEAAVDAFVGAYNSGDTDVVLALLADDVAVTEQYGGAAPNPNDDPLPNPDQQLAWKLAQGEIITEPTCDVAANQPAEGATLICRYTTLDAFVQAVDGTPIPTTTLFTIVDAEITELHQAYGNPDYSILAISFRQWIEENHPDMLDALFADFGSRDEAVEQGRLRAEWAQEWARSLTDTDDAQAAQEPQPAIVAAALAAPIDGETQQSIVGDVTWTRIEGDETTGPQQISFEAEGEFYGTRFSISDEGTEPQPQWWRSTDGENWLAWTDPPEDTNMDVVGDTIWAESFQTAIGESGLSYWDGTAFVTVELPDVDGAPGEGLAIRFSGVFVEADLDGEIVVRRVESFGVPWDDLLGIEPPLEAVEEGGSWENTFRVRALECTDRFGGRSCTSDGGEPTWVIRPEIVEGVPTRIDLYDDDTGELITSVVPPDDGPPIDEVLVGIGSENSADSRTSYLIADSDGANARTVDWPFGRAGFAELNGRLFALSGRLREDLQLWVTDDLETWEQVAVPAGIDQNGISSLASNGSTMIVTTMGPFGPDGPLVTNQPMWITTDGLTWTPRQSALAGHQTRGPASAEFGWIEYHDALSSDEEVVNEAPSIAVSLDAETWQVMPIPVPAALAELGLDWSEANSDDGTIGWEWEVDAHGDTIFLVLSSNSGDQAQEIWVGRVEPS